MTQFFAKKLNKKGFTLAELLIVVAIIAILVAIAMPIFMGALEKARYATHQSNARSLKSMAMAELLGSPDFAKQKITDDTIWRAIGGYNYATEEYTLTSITQQDKGDPGMWISDTKITYLDENAIKIESANVTKIGRIPTGGQVYYIIQFTGQELNPSIVASNT